MDIVNSGCWPEILKFLQPKELPEIMKVSKIFNEICKADYLWKEACLLIDPQTQKDYYRVFCQRIKEILRYSLPIYEILKVTQTSEQKHIFRSMVKRSNPKIGQILGKYFYQEKTKKIFESYEDFIKCYGPLPLEIYWFFMLYNGQDDCSSGFLGHYNFYDVDVNLKLIPVRKSENILVIASSGEDEEQLCVFLDLQGKIGRGPGAVYCNSGVARTVLYLASSLSEYLQRYSDNVKEKCYPMINENILLYEYNAYASVYSKDGIKITARALYVPHLSRERRYLWTYYITIEADNPEKRWVLTTRSWIIRSSNGKVQKVNRQPGVIGLYPKIYAGCEPTHYASCAYLETTSGVMSGSFNFENLDNRDENIDVNVAQFRLELPLNSELIDISSL
ncbi:hypothetical protein SteCoe_18017 [Stentor coeruleus]|uniref:ApaG domain-containing protein n=1 Tax=Stentor coeruleus TaxID=5963 RepID=A0A1R2BXI1_9CILI|nr:hypothetical protein SteCoe_18017 [Stentor coeruleus]